MRKLRRLLAWLYVYFRRCFGLVKTYYVDQRGDDNLGDGTFENPWLTLKRAVVACRAGDTIHVLPGTYITAGVMFWNSEMRIP